MKSGPLDQSRFKSGHQIGQTSRLKRRLDLGRRISAQQISATEADSDISTDISKISAIYRRYFRYIDDISPKKSRKMSPTRVSHVSKFRPKYRPDSDISPKYRRYLPIFCDFSSKRLYLSNIASLTPDTINIADISADISDILVLGYYLISIRYYLNRNVLNPYLPQFSFPS